MMIILMEEIFLTDADIIRPVAFRPYLTKRNETKETVTAVMSYSKQEHEVQKKIHSSEELEKTGAAAVNDGNRRGVCQPSTSSEASSLASVQYSARSVKSDIEENDYDVVPEYYERDKVFSDGNKNDETVIITNNFFKKSLSTHQVYSVNDGRRSSGVHITPSPSDSGIVDYETIIRDKENELTNVRTTMEQNEEIIIRVYQEKERVWEEEIADLKQKLQASQQGENALRLQIQLCNEQRDEFQMTINNLLNDKNALQKKV
ncbi:unnamed protein product [Enterobius vermicularis]|uniref:Leucine-rich repeat-containing protein DDB_G0290503 n=1 Tax=Enterobius vermicularis TaxID=51028 RepID=A0A0N4VF83_ENTVE|nr:unnamed protein product [Enterobius vermicularis]